MGLDLSHDPTSLDRFKAFVRGRWPLRFAACPSFAPFVARVER
jgi:hypothetical protein